MCNLFKKRKDNEKKKNDPAAKPPRPSNSSNSTTPSTPPPNLLGQAKMKKQYYQEVELIKKNYLSYYSQYRKVYRKEDCSLSQVSTREFTEMIRLPQGLWNTTNDVFKAKHYTLEKQIGKGGYGVVYKTRWDGENETKFVATKMINLLKSDRNRMLNHLKVEIFILESYPHPNIITLLDHFIIDDSAYIIMEFADAGCLADEIEDYGPLDENLTYEYFVQILKGIFYLHTFHIAHRDLKLDNILLVKSPENRNTKIVKITDFGLSLAAYRPKEGRIKPGTYGGTRHYMSPEIIALELFEDLEDEDSSTFEFDPFKADIWALGICLYELLTTLMPFETFKGNESMYNAQMNRTWSFPRDIKLSKEVKKLIREMLEPNTRKRIDPFGIWMHQWIQKCYVDNDGWRAAQQNIQQKPREKRGFIGGIIRKLTNKK